MKAKHIVYFFLAITLLSCGNKKPKFEFEPDLSTDYTSVALKHPSGNVKFDFTAYQLYPNHAEQNLIEIRGTLMNDNLHSVFYLTSTCNGNDALLKYDTAEFSWSPIVSCNASYPFVSEIKPKTMQEFHTRLRNKKNATEIKLDFYFLEVDKIFDVSKLHLSDAYSKIANEGIIMQGEKKQINAYPNIASDENEKFWKKFNNH